jgi:uncharacterized protein
VGRIRVRVTPGARRPGLAGWAGGVLRVRVSAPPERGRANEALRALLAETLGVPVRVVTVVRGAASREKVVEVEGMGDAELQRALGG